MGKSIPVEQRFWSKVAVGEPDSCWEWLASRQSSGYGQIAGGPGRSPLRAHRVAYELSIGPIPDGLEIDHLCKNRGCVNPAHMEPVTRAENLRRSDSPSGRNFRKTHCPRGHEYTPDNIYMDGSSRTCRTCRLAAARASYYANR